MIAAIYASALSGRRSDLPLKDRANPLAEVERLAAHSA
jgi:hypothetical protein